MNATLPAAPLEDSEDTWSFDWRKDPSIVCEEQPALAVYQNPRGQCVIRQERRWDEEDDTVILVCGEYAVRVAHAILSAVGMVDIEFVRPSGGGYEDVPIEASVASIDERPRDRTGAERQKRFRNRHRNGVERDETVTRNAQPLLIAAE